MSQRGKEKMKPLRYYFAFFTAKFFSVGLKMIGRNATHSPGTLALSLCPQFLKYIDKPKKIVAITGTNGKTSTANLTESILEKLGEKFTCNKLGSNVAGGIAAALLNSTAFFGKPKFDFAVFEVDERSAPRVFPFIKPEIILITNIFRDSYRRNAHVEFIADILNSNIPKTSKLILNADDPVCSNLAPDNEKRYFSLALQDFEGESYKSLVKDGAICPNCYENLEYKFTRYHHIGNYYCKACDYAAPTPQYEVINIDRKNRSLSARIGEKILTFNLIDKNIINVYNQISAIALLNEMGYDMEKVARASGEIEIVKTRLSKTEVGGKTVVSFLSKGQNPIACSRAFSTAKDFKGNKAVVLLIDDVNDARKSVENTAYLFDADFEVLNDEEIKQIIIYGPRKSDLYIRLLLAGIDKSIILQAEDIADISNMIKIDEMDSVIVYHDILLPQEAKSIKDAVVQRIKGGREDES